MRYLLIIIFLLTILGGGLHAKDKIRLGDWLDKYNSIVINYLQELDESLIGKKVSGVLLSDVVELKGYIFLGKARGLGKGVNIYLFSLNNKKVAYIWVEKGGDPLPLPACKDEVPPGQRVLSGDVYTWRAVQPGHGVVISLCPKESWIGSTSLEQ